MKRLTLIAALPLLVAAAGDDHTAVAKEMLETLEKAVKALENVSDEASANAARPELKKAGLRLEDLRKRAKGLKQPTKEEKDRLEREFQPKFDEVLRQLRQESVRIRSLPGGAAALKELALPPEKKPDPEKGQKK